jgi:hypothetical protein
MGRAHTGEPTHFVVHPHGLLVVVKRRVLRTQSTGEVRECEAHAAVSPRPPISLDTSVARTRVYTYAAKVWDFSIVQGPPRANP